MKSLHFCRNLKINPVYNGYKAGKQLMRIQISGAQII